jgi:hypothetical protein
LLTNIASDPWNVKGKLEKRRVPKSMREASGGKDPFFRKKGVLTPYGPCSRHGRIRADMMYALGNRAREGYFISHRMKDGEHWREECRKTDEMAVA